MIFYDPMTSPNSVKEIGDQFTEQIQTHELGVSDAEARLFTKLVELRDQHSTIANMAVNWYGVTHLDGAMGALA